MQTSCAHSTKVRETRARKKEQNRESSRRQRERERLEVQEEGSETVKRAGSCVLIIIFSSSTFAISLHTDLCINYTVRP